MLKAQYLNFQINHGKVQVLVGSSKMYFDLSSLEKGQPFLIDTTSKHTPNSTLKVASVPSEINLLGYNVEDARSVLDKYLDDCVIAGLSSTRIVHGKGTGALRKGVQEYLKENPHVKSFRYGTFGEGEMGVTIVELK